MVLRFNKDRVNYYVSVNACLIPFYYTFRLNFIVLWDMSNTNWSNVFIVRSSTDLEKYENKKHELIYMPTSK